MDMNVTYNFKRLLVIFTKKFKDLKLLSSDVGF